VFPLKDVCLLYRLVSPDSPANLKDGTRRISRIAGTVEENLLYSRYRTRKISRIAGTVEENLLYSRYRRGKSLA